MHLENIHEGDVFKNYKELCAALGITTMGGNTKKSNLKKLAQHCEYEINGREFRIKKIYFAPLLLTNQNQNVHKERYLFAPAIQQILLYELAQHDINTTYEQLYKNLWFVNENYSDFNAITEFLSLHDNINYDNLADVKQRIVSKSKSLITYALQTLKKKGAINYYNQYYVTTTDDVIRPATTEEETLYKKLEYNLIYNYFHCKNIREIFKKKLSSEYYSLLTKNLIEDGIKDMKIHLCVTSTGKYVSSYSEKEILFLKKTINKDMKRFIHTQIKKEYSITASQIRQSSSQLHSAAFRSLYSAMRVENLKIADTVLDFMVAQTI